MFPWTPVILAMMSCFLAGILAGMIIVALVVKYVDGEDE